MCWPLTFGIFGANYGQQLALWKLHGEAYASHLGASLKVSSQETKRGTKHPLLSAASRRLKSYKSERILLSVLVLGLLRACRRARERHTKTTTSVLCTRKRTIIACNQQYVITLGWQGSLRCPTEGRFTELMGVQ
ncbi:hypothetical protein VFPPC_15991 [Pochonia chlamydosporia 170]|uniref:Uncharacterized protein n=1 Tax=Pochonia chlamydosporia 170 TaxID=1380566 RepID=A0A179FLS8_METCM|nr:hypothetical protein VFPPC_15991 [Pochonia chlamydosporia 170]OAQ66161.1 hypothetical protein VFPPC_15991 [Pochonia chlamydosporia 170]